MDIIEEVVADPVVLRAMDRAVVAVRACQVPIDEMELGEVRVLRIMEEARRSIARHFLRARSTRAVMQRQLLASTEASVTSKAPVGRGYSTVPIVCI